MRYRSTRGEAASLAADEALLAGAAPDGGLYMPEKLPQFRIEDFAGAASLGEIAEILLAPFFEDSALAGELPAICQGAFDFDCPRVQPDRRERNLHVLELFHGPTGAFKDFGARFLFRCFGALHRSSEDPVTVLVATSGDTGGAVGCAAEEVPGTRAVILYPKGRISAFQEHQLTCWKPPVEALRVDADFDRCQAMVKQAFADAELRQRHRLTSANSISIGRLLPQMVYWARAALELAAAGERRPGLIVPTGNLGNGFAAILARACGLPIGPVILATNANSTLTDWHTTGVYQPSPAIATIANAMDIGSPSNFERLSALPGEQVAGVISASDRQIRRRIEEVHAACGYVICPHTATAFEAYHDLGRGSRRQRPWIIGATAHPAKFADVVEPLIGKAVPLPASLAAVLDRPVRVSDIAGDADALAGALAKALTGA